MFASGSAVTYLAHGLITANVMALAIMLGPFHIAAMWAGSLPVHRTPERTYRLVAYMLIAMSALVSLPAFDHFLR